MTTFKIYQEWLCDSENNIVYKPLSFWLDYFRINPIEGYNNYFKTSDGKFIDIEVNGGYGMEWNDRALYLDELFFVCNADLDRAKIRIKRD